MSIRSGICTCSPCVASRGPMAHGNQRTPNTMGGRPVYTSRSSPAVTPTAARSNIQATGVAPKPITSSKGRTIMAAQLRIYRLDPDRVDEFVELWREQIVPARKAAGFKVQGAWV
ncbi:MAG: NIPSNAP family protein, partial [Acidimicrobiia bacterium]|nr:NIPSNAP family protein [Acidimicrobiia bacterium]